MMNSEMKTVAAILSLFDVMSAEKLKDFQTCCRIIKQVKQQLIHEKTVMLVGVLAVKLCRMF